MVRVTPYPVPIVAAACARSCSTFVRHARYADGMATSIGFRPTAEDQRILREAARPGESTSDTLRRAVRLLDRDRWETQFREDAAALAGEDLSGEPDAW